MHVSDHVVATNVNSANLVTDSVTVHVRDDMSCCVANRYNQTSSILMIVEAEAEQ